MRDQASTTTTGNSPDQALTKPEKKSLVDTILEQTLNPIAQTQEKRKESEGWLRDVIEEALKEGTRDISLTRMIRDAVARIDELISRQVREILHHPDFQALEGSWRGVKSLIDKTPQDSHIQFELLHCTKDELVDDFQSAPTEAESALYSKVFNRYDAFGAKPIGAIVGDFEFANTSDDIYLLKQLSKVGAANHCPILTAVSPAMFKYDRWEQIAGDSNPIDIFDRKAYIEWKSFRQSADSKYVTLTMPRVLARLPHSRASNRTSEFAFDEIERNSKDGSLVISTEKFVWMNAAYALAGCMTRSFYDYGLCTAIRGVENGGVVDNLPVYTYTTEDGDVDQLCPTEVAIGGKLEYDLSKAGIMALCHHTESDKAVFYSSQTANKPQEFGDENRRSVEETQATANAAICARLTYLMVVSRFSHYLKAIARDKIGSPKDRADLEKCLDGWLANYRCSAATPSDTEKRTKPLRDYSVTVEGIPGRPGCYQAVMYLRPWLGLEELTVSMRVVNELPNSAARQ